jgi:uncharacterized RDD family membrane protein YckC
LKERASFGLRAVALVIDLVLLLALSTVIGLMAGSSAAVLLHKFGWAQVAHDPTGAAVATGFMAILVAVVVTSLVATLLSLPYNLMEALVGWTPGKLVTGLRVRHQDGSRPSFSQVFARWLIKHNAVLLAVLTLSGIPFTVLSPIGQLVVFVGCFLALGPARQALHDLATKTAVYELSQIQESDNSVL